MSALRALAQKAEATGIRVLYHNHDHEFAAVEEIIPIDEIQKDIMLELDCYWVFFAGGIAKQYIVEHKEHVGLIHIKDGFADKRQPVALGEGENDDPTPPGLQDAARSLKYLYNLI